MRTSTASINVQVLVERINSGKICNDLEVNRQDNNWKPEQKSLLIDTIIRGYNMPAIWITKTLTQQFIKSTIIDGTQRLGAIYNYVNDKYKLHTSIQPITIVATDENELDDDMVVVLAGKKFSELPKIIQDIIMDYRIDEIEMFDYTDEQIEQQFIRLNNGSTFTKAQTATAKLGSEIAEKVHKIEHMDFWKKTSFSKTQRNHAEITSCILQSFMLINEKDYSSFGGNTVVNYAAEFAKEATDEDFAVMGKIIETLDKCLPDTEDVVKFMKKINIPAVIQCTKTFLDYKSKGMITDEQFGEFIEYFVDTGAECSGYYENCGTGSQSRTKVENRVKILNDWFIDHIKRINHIEGIDDIIDLEEDEKDNEDEIIIDTYGEEEA